MCHYFFLFETTSWSSLICVWNKTAKADMRNSIFSLKRQLLPPFSWLEPSFLTGWALAFFHAVFIFTYLISPDSHNSPPRADKDPRLCCRGLALSFVFAASGLLGVMGAPLGLFLCRYGAGRKSGHDGKRCGDGKRRLEPPRCHFLYCSASPSPLTVYLLRFAKHTLHNCFTILMGSILIDHVQHFSLIFAFKPFWLFRVGLLIPGLSTERSLQGVSFPSIPWIIFNAGN